MMEFNDLQLDKWRTPIEPERSSSRWLVTAAIVLVIAAVAGAGYYLVWRKSQPAPQDVRVHTEQSVAQAPAAKPGA